MTTAKQFKESDYNVQTGARYKTTLDNNGSLFGLVSAIFNPFANIVFDFATTDVSTANDTITETDHGLLEDDVIQFTTSAADLPAGLSLATDYHVIATGLTADVFKVSASQGGAAIDLTDTGSGTHTATLTTGLTMRLGKGLLVVADAIPTAVAVQEIAAVSAPSANPRKDIVTIDKSTGAYTVTTGSENASPVDPTVPTNGIPVARINMVVSQTTIENADIDDLRAMPLLGTSETDLTSLRTNIALNKFGIQVNNANTLAAIDNGWSDELNDTTGYTGGSVGDYSAANDTFTNPSTVPMVVFDGSNDYLTRGADLTSNADGKQGIVSIWYDPTGGDGVQQQIYMTTSGNFAITKLSSNKISITGWNVGGSTKILEMISTTTYTASSGMIHILAAWDLSAGTPEGWLYIDDADVLDTGADTFIDENIDYTNAEHAIGATTAGGSKLTGELGQFYFNNVTFLDLSTESNRRKFISASGGAIWLGSDGSTPTATAPIIFFNNATASWHTNLGGGGGFTENGALTDGTDITVITAGAISLITVNSDDMSPSPSPSVAPTTGYLYFLATKTGTPTINTDVIGKVSSDGGSTKDTITLTEEQVMIAGTEYTLYSGEVTLTGAGTNMMADIATANGEVITIKALNVSWS